jgi:tRNA U34 5-methylaminomethyl-2-thiouridine-forming methyltransferase MnmC
VKSESSYKLVRLRNGTNALHSVEFGETMHPTIGPVAEAEALYVRQLRLVERLREHEGQFVIWDVGLGGAANALAVLRTAGTVSGAIRLISFDKTTEPLEFALRQPGDLKYLAGFESRLRELLDRGCVSFETGSQRVEWDLQVADFPALLDQPAAESWPKPHLILFDPFSPARNPAMWTQPLFTALFRLLDPAQSCVMPTYSRSTMLRVSLLLAGFFVGIGHAAGMKEETTVAANSLALIEAPLARRWLEKARRSASAEPLSEPIYRQAPLSRDTWEKLSAHPQFK